MDQENDLWSRQFIEMIKDVAIIYDQFDKSREIEYLDKSEALCEELNDQHGVSIDLLDYVNFGRAWLKKDSPSK